jgi:hypothetical protein
LNFDIKLKNIMTESNYIGLARDIARDGLEKMNKGTKNREGTGGADKSKDDKQIVNRRSMFNLHAP